MKTSRVIWREAEKLLRAPVFLVAPLVLTLYLFLMVFGFEVYAAKNGKPLADGATIGGQTGSVVISAYAAVRHMVFNVIGIPETSLKTVGEPLKEVALPPIDAAVGKTKKQGDFDFFGTLLRNLADPKPLPSSCCPCPDTGVASPHSGENAPGPAKPVSSPATPMMKSLLLWLPGLMVGNAWAETLAPPLPPAPPPGSSFMERLQGRLDWLMAPVPLEKMVIDRSRYNGMRFTYLSFHFAYIFIFPLIAVAVAAQLFAVEFGGGTIRCSLLLPVNRRQVFLAKMAVLWGYLVVLMFAFLAVTLVLGCLVSGYGNLVIDSELFGAENARMIIGDGAVLLFLGAVPLASLSMLPLAAFAVFLSLYKPEPAYVIGLSTITYLILFSLGGLSLFEGVRWFFFTTYMDSWPLLFEGNAKIGAITGKLAVLMVMGGAVALHAYQRFSSKDIYV